MYFIFGSQTSAGRTIDWYATCLLPDMGSRFLCLLSLTLLTVAGTVFRLGQASPPSFTVPMHQYERIARALDQYRVLASEDDGERMCCNYGGWRLVA
jgi:hypothetical protein